MPRQHFFPQEELLPGWSAEVDTLYLSFSEDQLDGNSRPESAKEDLRNSGRWLVTLGRFPRVAPYSSPGSEATIVFGTTTFILTKAIGLDRATRDIIALIGQDCDEQFEWSDWTQGVFQRPAPA